MMEIIWAGTGDNKFMFAPRQGSTSRAGHVRSSPFASTVNTKHPAFVLHCSYAMLPVSSSAPPIKTLVNIRHAYRRR